MTLRRAQVVVVLLALMVTAACGGLVSPLATNATSVPGAALADGLPLGTSVHGLAVPGRPRSFRVHRPASLPATGPAALVVVLHGDGASALGVENHYGWDAVADRAGFLVAYPDASHGWSWNAADGACCGRAGADRSDDLGFLTGMISTIAATVAVDPARIYATGPSAGGMMAYRLACATGIPAAIGPVGATELTPCPRPPPTSVLHIHGSADSRIRFDGRPGDGPQHVAGAPVDAVVTRWRTVDRCPAPRTTVAGPIRTTAADCPDGRGVTLIEIEGAGSQWPGATSQDLVTPTSVPPPEPGPTALNAADTLWAFFAAHPRR